MNTGLFPVKMVYCTYRWNPVFVLGLVVSVSVPLLFFTVNTKSIETKTVIPLCWCVWKCENHMNKFILKIPFIKIYIYQKYFYKNKKSKLCFGDRVAVQNDFIFKYGWSIFDHNQTHWQLATVRFSNDALLPWDEKQKSWFYNYQSLLNIILLMVPWSIN